MARKCATCEGGKSAEDILFLGKGRQFDRSYYCCILLSFCLSSGNCRILLVYKKAVC